MVFSKVSIFDSYFPRYYVFKSLIFQRWKFQRFHFLNGSDFCQVYFQEFRFLIPISIENILQGFHFQRWKFQEFHFFNGSDLSKVFSRVLIFDSDFPRDYFFKSLTFQRWKFKGFHFFNGSDQFFHVYFQEFQENIFQEFGFSTVEI